jgi:hypothetical protein
LKPPMALPPTSATAPFVASFSPSPQRHLPHHWSPSPRAISVIRSTPTIQTGNNMFIVSPNGQVAILATIARSVQVITPRGFQILNPALAALAQITHDGPASPASAAATVICWGVLRVLLPGCKTDSTLGTKSPAFWPTPVDGEIPST